ncbi:hypothetical protein QR680_005983 [Steinernema hermaphroditum]|uniref:Uncharacterized protein n=1 Tax=Steinernema hermaphroditum TaxID=289476 RepID=A0AA39HTW6_9BILA|nr:hypothetical protein QR680_005983 [Steinernema hermaphroditum]
MSRLDRLRYFDINPVMKQGESGPLLSPPRLVRFPPEEKVDEATLPTRTIKPTATSILAPLTATFPSTSSTSTSYLHKLRFFSILPVMKPGESGPLLSPPRLGRFSGITVSPIQTTKPTLSATP